MQDLKWQSGLRWSDHLELVQKPGVEMHTLIVALRGSQDRKIGSSNPARPCLPHLFQKKLSQGSVLVARGLPVGVRDAVARTEWKAVSILYLTLSVCISNSFPFSVLVWFVHPRQKTNGRSPGSPWLPVWPQS